jgi:tRNA A-37 threonylcarbamoyl transferase component Bud32
MTATAPQQAIRLTGESSSFLVAEPFREALAELGLRSLDAVFAFDSARDLAKPSLSRFRRRLQFEVVPTGAARPVKVFLKRYDRPPALEQLRNWLPHRRRSSFAFVERETADRLRNAGINTPRVAACGERWGILFEHRSFLMTAEIEDSESLERKLPPCFDGPATPARRDFIRRLAAFVRRFHETGYRHRDLYLSHIFCSGTGEFTLIDLARASRPVFPRRRQVKDVAQLHYSAPAAAFSRTDRMRFYRAYTGRPRLLPRDKVFIRQVMRKADRMARHNLKHGVPVPFLER